jgi:antitoxin (DNA-binding transcriptional repressor) of toxin-antitoxin stability system
MTMLLWSDEARRGGTIKATCLKLMDKVAATGEPVEITKRGKALVRLDPADPETGARRPILGAASHRVLFLAEAEELFSTGETWDADR